MPFSMDGSAFTQAVILLPGIVCSTSATFFSFNCALLVFDRYGFLTFYRFLQYL